MSAGALRNGWCKSGDGRDKCWLAAEAVEIEPILGLIKPKTGHEAEARRSSFSKALFSPAFAEYQYALAASIIFSSAASAT